MKRFIIMFCDELIYIRGFWRERKTYFGERRGGGGKEREGVWWGLKNN